MARTRELTSRPVRGQPVRADGHDRGRRPQRRALRRAAAARGRAAGAHAARAGLAGDTDHWQDKLAPAAVRPRRGGVLPLRLPAGSRWSSSSTASARAFSSAPPRRTRPSRRRASAPTPVCLQAATAGGHRGTHTVAATPNDLDAPALLAAVRPLVSVPLVVAGGLATGQQVRAVLDAGAAAVQVGTALLRTPEAGTRAGPPRGAGLRRASGHRRHARVHRPRGPGAAQPVRRPLRRRCPRGLPGRRPAHRRACVPVRRPTATSTAWRCTPARGTATPAACPPGRSSGTCRR